MLEGLQISGLERGGVYGLGQCHTVAHRLVDGLIVNDASTKNEGVLEA